MQKILLFLFEGNRMLYHILLNRYPYYDPGLSRGKNGCGSVESKQSCFFEHEEIKKPLQLPEILGPLKAQK